MRFLLPIVVTVLFFVASPVAHAQVSQAGDVYYITYNPNTGLATGFTIRWYDAATETYMTRSYTLTTPTAEMTEQLEEWEGDGTDVVVVDNNENGTLETPDSDGKHDKVHAF